jgi:hypothetical protein
MNNANEVLSEYTGTENHYKYNRYLITDGAKAFADNFSAYWFLDIICSYQYKLSKHSFQVWIIKLNKTGNGALVVCEDGNANKLISQRIPFIDFPYKEGKLFFIEGVILLPSEY